MCLSHTEVSSFKLYYVTISTLQCDAFNHFPCKHINALGTFPEISIWSSYRTINVTRSPPHTTNFKPRIITLLRDTFKHLGMHGHQCATTLPQKQPDNSSPKSSRITLPPKQPNNTPPQKSSISSASRMTIRPRGHRKVQVSSSQYATLPSLRHCVTHSKQDIFYACTSR